LAQQQQARIRSHFATVESDFDVATPKGSKQVSLLGTIWHRRNPPREWTSSTHLTRENKIAPTSFFANPVKYSGYPVEVTPALLRTLQRRLRLWRGLNGGVRDVYFAQ
jgi:hypothetical protein